MYINQLPFEIFDYILKEAARLNEKEGVTFTFGFSKAPVPPPHTPSLQRYIRGYLPPDLRRWDAAAPLRQVCASWHDWALGYVMQDVYLQKGRGKERWSELPLRRSSYEVYEKIDPSGMPVYKDPSWSLRRSAQFLSQSPKAATKINRMWLSGYYTFDTDDWVVQIMNACQNLTCLSVPWTLLRRLSSTDWSHLLRADGPVPLRSLELLAVDLPRADANTPQNQKNMLPLMSSSVNFGELRKLKIFGDTNFMPITDDDLQQISRSATGLEEFHLTCLSTITIAGVMAVVKSSKNTLRVLEHSPRSNDGFFHPHPGSLADSEHLCETLSSCPLLETVSLSVPSVCAQLFANENVRWRGDFQVRAAHLCGHDAANTPDIRIHDGLSKLLRQARQLVHRKTQSHLPTHLAVELFFADFIFEPHCAAVHGDFQLPEQASANEWPVSRAQSRKGPYGSTGLYAKDEEGTFERVSEHEFLDGLRRRWISLIL